MTYNCIKCGVELDDENWYSSRQKKGDYICKECGVERGRLYRENNPEKYKAYYTRANRDNGHLPFNENKECSSYFGVHINERMLRHLFNDVEVMPYGNRGYDFVCNKGKKVDSKSSCIMKNKNGWAFAINHNTITDYFLLVAYDNRKDLNPLHIWLIPGEKVNHLVGLTISQSTLHKWSEYEQNIDDAIICCDTIKDIGDNNV